MGTGYLAFGLLFLALLVGLGISRFVYGKDQAFSDAAGTFQTVLTAGAILLAGYWYFVERRGMPHADITPTVVVEPISPGYAAVEAHIAVKNVGETKLDLDWAQIRLQQISPPPDPPGILIPEQLANLKRTEWPTKAPVNPQGRRLPIFQGAELQWPSIRVYKDAIQHEIEPGETDLLIASFVVKCDVKVLRIKAYVRKEGSDPEVGWHTAAFANTSEACGEKE